MPSDPSGRALQVTAVASGLCQAITGGAIAPGERIRVGSPGWPCGLSGTTARSALAITRRQGLAHWHRHEYYAAPAGSPQPAVGARLGRFLAGIRCAAGVTVGGLATRIVDADGPWGPSGRQYMISRRADEITAAENGAWQPRRVWQHIDAAVGASGTLLRVHDNLYACQHLAPAHPNPRKARLVMSAMRCTCGFTRLDDEEVTDHLLAAFAPADSTGSDGHLHEELAGLACSCGFAATSGQELDSHFLAVFTPAGSLDRGGVKHEAAA